jgi:signal transduction histidine kinase
VDDLIDVNRVIQGKVDLRKEPTDLGAVVGRALESSRPHLEERKHRLEVDLPREPLPVEADTLRLVQVLTNIINNAAKYTPPGGRIRVSAGRFPERPGRAAIRVEDTGVGLKPEMLQKIFDLFAQGPAEPSGSGGGLGVGLALARRLAEMHGGTVVASSEGPGRGSCFTVELPLRAEGETGSELS